MNYNNTTQQEKNKLAAQYEALVNKITAQFFKKGLMGWDDIKSMAYEGLAIAFTKYDEERSDMSFVQYAAYSIRNNILTCTDNELRTVKLSNYAQKKATMAGEALYNSVSMTTITGSRDDGLVGKGNDRISKEFKYGLYEGPKWEYGDAYAYIYSRVEEEFNERDCQMFYMVFGLKGHEETKGKDIAKYFGISEGLVSQKVKKVIKFIKNDEELCEILGNL